MKKILSFCAALILFTSSAALAEGEIPAAGADRFWWAVSCCSNVPVWLSISVAVLIAAIVFTIITYKKHSVGGQDE